MTFSFGHWMTIIFNLLVNFILLLFIHGHATFICWSIYLTIRNKRKNLTSHFGMVQKINLKTNFSEKFQFYFSIYFNSFDKMPDPVAYKRQRKLFRFCCSIINSSVQSVSLKNRECLKPYKSISTLQLKFNNVYVIH